MSIILLFGFCDSLFTIKNEISGHQKSDTCAERKAPIATIAFVDGCAIKICYRRCEIRVLFDVKQIVSGVSKEAPEPVFDILSTKCSNYDFQNNAGLGVATSKQIIGDNEDVIWAENIRLVLAGVASETMETSFVACLSV